MSKKILLFIPFYNCEKQLPRVLNKVLPYVSYFSEILLVNNKSTDKSLEVLLQYFQTIKINNTTVIQNLENYSLGGSHKVAFQYALKNNFDYIIVLHGDDQADVGEIIPIINKGLHLKYDCLLGARFHPDSTLQGYSRFRTFGNIVLNSLCSIVCKRKVLDMGSGLNMYSRLFIQDQRITGFRNDLTFNVFLLFHGYFNNHKTRFFPLTWREEDQVSNAKVFNQFLIILKLILTSLFNKKSIYQQIPSKDYQYEVKYSA